MDDQRADRESSGSVKRFTSTHRERILAGVLSLVYIGGWAFAGYGISTRIGVWGGRRDLVRDYAGAAECSRVLVPSWYSWQSSLAPWSVLASSSANRHYSRCGSVRDNRL